MQTPLNGQALTPKEMLGKLLFLDTTLSTPPGQSCATCHARETGFTGPDALINATTGVYPGAVHTRFGNRKPPTSAYAGASPPLHYDAIDDVWVGGQFWDGRAATLAEQAKGPFLNPVEQNNPNKKKVVLKVRHSGYAALFIDVYGANAFDDVDTAYDLIADAIAAYEMSDEVNPYSSKYDCYLAGRTALTAQEAWGLELFEGKGNCAACHPSQSDNGAPPLFTDFTYDNLGIPRYEDNPFYDMPRHFNPDGDDFVDLGLAATVGDPAESGKFKVPTLRNVDLRPSPDFVKSYGHNGFFKSLEEIVRFYDERDVAPPQWPAAEVPETVNHDELGNLGLTDAEELAVVVFLKTLSDGYTCPATL